MITHKEISHKVRGPTRFENARHLLVCVYRERCVRIIHSVCGDFEARKLFFVRPYIMPRAHQSKRRACVQSSLLTLIGNLPYFHLFESQRGDKPQNFEFFVVRGCTNPHFKELISEQHNHRSHTVIKCDDYNEHLLFSPKIIVEQLSWPIFQLGQECIMYITFSVLALQQFAWHFFVIIAQTLVNLDVPLFLGQGRKFKL